MLRNYGTYDNFEQKNLGDEMKRYELVSYVDAYCSREGIRPHDIMINISSDLLSTASMGKLNNYGVLSLKLGSIYKGTLIYLSKDIFCSGLLGLLGLHVPFDTVTCRITLLLAIGAIKILGGRRWCGGCLSISAKLAFCRSS